MAYAGLGKIVLPVNGQPGIIYDRNLNILAGHSTVYSVYANPIFIAHQGKVKEVAARLSDILNIPTETISTALEKKKYFVWIQHYVSYQIYKKLKDVDLPGIGFIAEPRRNYPYKKLAIHLLGFRDMNNQGIQGIEQEYDRYLRGKKGKVVILYDFKGERPDQNKYISLVNGADVVLTIDYHIQSIAENALDKMYKKSRAKDASIIVMNPRTGEILALANRPIVYRSNSKTLTNYAIESTFQPGSVFKFVLASAALQEGVVKEDDLINCEHGAYHIVQDHYLHDHEPYDLLTFKQVIENSSNIGTAKVAQRLGLQRIYKYVHRFHFGQKTGIDLPHEASGELPPVSRWTEAAVAAVPIGQEIPVTPIQLLGGISSIANGGIYMKPYVMKFIKDGNRVIKNAQPKILVRDVSLKTANRVKNILKGVIDEGTGVKAQIPGVAAAGKTGTAQKIVDGKYSHKYFYTTFAGFAPLEDPLLSIVIVFDEPHPNYYSSEVAAPVFKEVMEESLKYLKSSK